MRLQIGIALALVYFIWGSSYLAIRIALESLPPLMMAGARFVTGGIVLLAIARGRGAPPPTGAHWRSGFAIGALMMVVGNGGVCWSEQHVPSGIAALMIATTPLWMCLLGWAQGHSARPRARTLVGLALGFAGVAGLVVGGGDTRGRIDPLFAAVLLVSAASWAQGSLLSRHLPLPRSAMVSTALQMAGGGALLLIVGAMAGEVSRIDLAHTTWRAWAALAYLTVVASLVAFTAYVWLLQVASPSLVATYAYVNPVVAVTLGWALAGEAVTPALLAAAAVILAGVALIVSGERRQYNERTRLAAAGKKRCRALEVSGAGERSAGLRAEPSDK